MKNDIAIHEGEIFLPDFSADTVKSDRRPYIVLGTIYDNTILCAGLTTNPTPNGILIKADEHNHLNADGYIKCHHVRVFNTNHVHKRIGMVNDYGIIRAAREAAGNLINKCLAAPAVEPGPKLSDHITETEDGLGSSRLNLQPVAETPPPKVNKSTTPKVEVANDGPPPKASRKQQAPKPTYNPSSPLGKGIKQIATKERDWVALPFENEKNLRSMRVNCYQVAKRLGVSVKSYRAEGNQLVVMRKESA